MPKARIAPALRDLLFTPDLDLVTAVDRHFAPDYRQRTDGEWSDRTGFVEHIAHLRTVVAGGDVVVHEELSSDQLYAERHTITVTKADGGAVTTEVYVFAEYADDGRFRRVEETTLMLSGSETDRGLGSARA